MTENPSLRGLTKISNDYWIHVIDRMCIFYISEQVEMEWVICIYFKPNSNKLSIGSPLIKDLLTRVYLDL